MQPNITFGIALGDHLFKHELIESGHMIFIQPLLQEDRKDYRPFSHYGDLAG